MLTVVVPVYNAEQTITRLAEELQRHLPDGSEVIFVDDGSRDRSWELARSLATENTSWKAIRLGRNFGQHAALLAGIRAARHDVIVTMDDDLQHRASEVQLLLSQLRPGTDLVYGVARAEEHGAMRSLSSRVVKRVLRLSMGVPYADRISAFRAFRTMLRESFQAVSDPFISIDVLLSWATDKVDHIEVDMDLRTAGQSNYTMRKLARHSFDMVTGYSAAPLRVVAHLGMLLSVVGFSALTYVLVRYFAGTTEVAGFTFLAAMLSLTAGVQMLAIAVIGEYLGRIHFRAMRKPAYVIAEVFSDDVA